MFFRALFSLFLAFSATFGKLLWVVNTMHVKEILHEVINENLDKLILSNRKQKSYEFQKITGRLVSIKGKTMLQLERFTATQAMHENIPLVEACDVLLSYATNYKQLDIYTATHTYAVKMKNMEDIYVTKKALEQEKQIVTSSQNKNKKYILQEGMNIPALVDLGVFTKDFKVVNSKYDKYRQLNRFIEMIDNVISKEDKEYYHIVDFGCGKSYLTFVLYYYFTEIKKKRVKIVGMDLKESVITHCNEVAKKYHYDDLHFLSGDIKDYVSEEPIDMMVTLHACDVATDIALYHAISKNARLIFSVPCCHHELNNQIHNDDINFVLKHGILKDRLSAIYTDAMRGQLLEICGYSVDMLEYVDDEGSLKNIMIRATYKGVSEEKKERLLNELTVFENQNNSKCMLHKLLSANGIV